MFLTITSYRLLPGPELSLSNSMRKYFNDSGSFLQLIFLKLPHIGCSKELRLVIVYSTDIRKSARLVVKKYLIFFPFIEPAFILPVDEITIYVETIW